MAEDARIEAIAAGIQALGEAYRDDWSDFDGRTLRAQLNGYADLLRSDRMMTYEQLCLSDSVCPLNRCWYEHCPDAIGRATCAHVAGMSAAETNQ